MRLEKYELEIDQTQSVFYFVSEGPKGRILKAVHYTKMKIKGIKNLYNLGFGDKLSDSEDIDDLIITDNQDRDKVLATVANTIDIFTERLPKAKIFIRGSSEVRTRLYRMAIDKYHDELSDYFDIQGYLNNKWVTFEKNISYRGFLITRKK
jgi:hypothetical protein